MTTSPPFGPPDEPPQYSPLPGRVKRPLPTTVLWRWRYETLTVLAISVGGWHAVRQLGAPLTLLTVAVVATLVGTIGPLRRGLRRRVLWVVTPHRIRVGLANAWVHNRRGRLPAVVCTRAADYGEAVILWCPAGVCERHVRAAADVLRAACWARHVQVAAHPRHRHLVMVHVVRRTVTEVDS